MKQLAVLCFGVLAISAADLVPVAGPRTEPFFVDPYFEEGSGLSIATSRQSFFSLVPGGLRLGSIGATVNFIGAKTPPRVGARRSPAAFANTLAIESSPGISASNSPPSTPEWTWSISTTTKRNSSGG